MALSARLERLIKKKVGHEAEFYVVEIGDGSEDQIVPLWNRRREDYAI